MSAQEKKEKAIGLGLCWLRDLADSKRGEAIRKLDPKQQPEVFKLCHMADRAAEVSEHIAHRLSVCIDEILQPNLYPDDESAHRQSMLSKSEDQLSILEEELSATDEAETVPVQDLDKPKVRTSAARKPAKKKAGKTK